MHLPRVPRALPLVWRAPSKDPSGYADEARAYLLALERQGNGDRGARPRLDARRQSSRRVSVRRSPARARVSSQPSSSAVHHLVPGAKLEPSRRRADRDPNDVRDRPDPGPLAPPPRRGRRDLGAVRPSTSRRSHGAASRPSGCIGCPRRSTSSSTPHASEREIEARPVHVPHQLRLHRPQGLGHAARRLGGGLRSRRRRHASS